VIALRVLPLALALVACSPPDELRVVNRLALTARLDVLAPRADLRGGCQTDFRERFCREEYVPIAVLDFAPGADRLLTISDAVSDEQCTNVLWLRLPWLDEVGPVDDDGTLLALPTAVEIEAGAGGIHSVAFPQATVRIDEVGLADPNQGFAPKTCAELGRAAR